MDEQTFMNALAAEVARNTDPKLQSILQWLTAIGDVLNQCAGDRHTRGQLHAAIGTTLKLSCDMLANGTTQDEEEWNDCGEYTKYDRYYVAYKAKLGPRLGQVTITAQARYMNDNARHRAVEFEPLVLTYQEAESLIVVP